MIVKALLIALAASSTFGAYQYWRADKLADKAKQLHVCEEVNEINNEVRHESDDDLSNRISDTR